MTTDVTIDDFANTLRIRARLKKSVTNVSNEGTIFFFIFIIYKEGIIYLFWNLFSNHYAVKQEAAIQEEKAEWDKTDEKNLPQNCVKGNDHRGKENVNLLNYCLFMHVAKKHSRWNACCRIYSTPSITLHEKRSDWLLIPLLLQKLQNNTRPISLISTVSYIVLCNVVLYIMAEK